MGLLAQVPAGATAHVSGRVHGYCLLANRLFVPVDGQFETDVDDRDWEELLPADDRCYVWHPTAGLIAIAEDRVLRVVDLLRPPPRTRGRIAVALAQGGVLCWGHLDERHQEMFAHDLVEPRVCLNRGGWLVAVNESEIQVYSTHENKLRFHAKLPGPGAAPIAVLPEQHIDQFAICTPQGQVQLFAIES